MNRIRVAHVVQYFALGGLERMVESLAIASRAYGIDSIVVAYLADGPVRGRLEANGVRTFFLPSAGGLSATLSANLGSLFMRERIDVVHTHHVGPFIYGAPVATLMGLPLVHTEHSHELYATQTLHMVGRAMDVLSTVVSVSEEIAEFRARRFGTYSRVLPNGIAIPTLPGDMERREARARFGLGLDDYVIGCVARLAPEKNHRLLLSALARLKDHIPHARLVLVGDGPQRSSLCRHIAELGLGSRVSLLGALDDVKSILPAFDTFALSSSREGMPLAVLEAMAAGVPVVATAVGALPKVLAGAGLLVPDGDANELAASLRALASSDSLRAQLAERGRARAESSYSLDAMVQAYANLYQTKVQARAARKQDVRACA